MDNNDDKKAGCADLSLGDISKITEEEFNRLCQEERLLRARLRTVNLWGKSPEEAATLLQASGLSETLNQWAGVHTRNRAIAAKRGDALVIALTSQLLLEANNILREREIKTDK